MPEFTDAQIYNIIYAIATISSILIALKSLTKKRQSTKIKNNMTKGYSQLFDFLILPSLIPSL
jgi:HJR/Mrr/RecB family endonuclease